MKLPPNSLHLARLAKRPAHRVDHAVERLRDLPDLLHAELPALRVQALQVEVVDRGAGQVAQRALGEHGRLRDHVGARLEVRQRLAVAAAALVAGAHAPDDPVLDQQLVGGGLGQHVDARLLGLLGEEAAELRDRGDVVAVVAEVRRHRLQRQRPLLGQQVDGVLGRPPGRPATPTGRGRGTAPASPRGACSRRRAGARPRPCPSRSRPPGPRRASRSARARPRAAA